MMGTFPVILLEKRLGDGRVTSGTRGWLIPLDALLSVGSVIPFDIRVLVGPMRRTNMGFDPQRDARDGAREKENRARHCHHPNGDRDQRSFDAGDHRSAKS